MIWQNKNKKTFVKKTNENNDKKIPQNQRKKIQEKKASNTNLERQNKI